MKAKKELIHQLETARLHKQWELSLAAMEARNGIPDILGDSPEHLCQLAGIYVMAAIQGPCYDWYMYLADCALHMAQQVSGKHTDDVIILRSQAFKVHMEYIVYGPVGKKGYACHRPDKLSLVNQAVYYYEMLMQENYTSPDMYHYATMLFKSAEDIYLPVTRGRRQMHLKKACTLYKKILKCTDRGELSEDKRLIRVKAGYYFCRAGLSLLKSHSYLGREAFLLFGVTLPQSQRVERLGRFHTLLRIASRLCRYCGLDGDVTGIEELARRPRSEFPYAGDIYYMMGQLYECAYEQQLYPWPEEALHRAKQYYTYACDIDYRRRQLRLSVSGYMHMYASLFRLFHYSSKGRKDVPPWLAYLRKLTFPPGLEILVRIRQCIQNGQYDDAASQLKEVMQSRQYDSFMTEKKVKVLRDITEVLCSGHTNKLCNRYAKWEKVYFEQILQSLNRHRDYGKAQTG